jgi:cytochrome c553
MALVALPGHASEDRLAARLVAETCALCHGPDGNSISPQFPRLAGQPAAYLEAQLKAFRARSRADPPAQAYMWGMASQLDDETISRLAAYFAARPAHPVQSAAPSEGQGRLIYESGLPDQGIPACVSCHGDSGRTGGNAARLSGQHPEYLVRQLSYFKTRLRTSDPVMLQVCSKLTTEQISAVASYAASH